MPENVEFLIWGLGLVRVDVDTGGVVLVYSVERHLSEEVPYRVFLRDATRTTAQVRRFADWLFERARQALAWVDGMARPAQRSV